MTQLPNDQLLDDSMTELGMTCDQLLNDLITQ